MMHTHMFPKVAISNDIKSDEVNDAVKLDEVKDDVKLGATPVDVKLDVGQQIRN